MRALRAAAAEAERRARHQKFHWCRLDNDFVDMPIWRVVAARLALPLYQVQAFAVRLESFANAALPRGHVGDFKAAEFAAALGMPADDAARIYAELEHDEIGWILQETVANFWQRNPDKPDATATERQQRKRARDKALRGLAKAHRLGQISDAERQAAEAELLGVRSELSTCHAVSRVTSRDSVTVTPQHSREQGQGSVDNFGRGDRGAAVGSARADAAPAVDKPPASAEEWLRSEGARIVTERMRLYPGVTSTKIERWKREVAGDADAVAHMIDAARQQDVRGDDFELSIATQIEQRQRDATEQRRLPLISRVRSTGGDAA